MGDGPLRQIVVDAADNAGILQFILFGVWGRESTFGSNVATSSAGAMGDFQFTAATKPGPNGTTVYYPMTNTPDQDQFQAQAQAAAGYLKYLYNTYGHDWDTAIQHYSGGGYGIQVAIDFYKSRINWIPASVTVQYEAWSANHTITPVATHVVSILAPGGGDYSNWSDLVKSAGQHANRRASNLRYLAARNRGALSRGVRYLPGPGKTTIAPGVSLHIRAPKIFKVKAPGVLTVGGGSSSVGGDAATVARNALKCCSETGRFHYAQVRPCSTSLWDDPFTGDCSAFATTAYRSAGLQDPNGYGYNPIGNTTSLQARGRRVMTPQAGDLAFYDNPAHVAVCMGDGTCAEFGGPGGPRHLPVNYRVVIEYRRYD